MAVSNGIPKRILFVIPNLGGGGAERVLVTLLENLDRSKVEPICVFYDSQHTYKLPYGLKSFVLNLPETSFMFKKVVRLILRIVKIKKITNTQKPNFVFSFMSQINLTVILSCMFMHYKPKIIVSERTIPSVQLSGNGGKILKFLIKVLYPKANKIIAISEGIKKDLISNFNLSLKTIQVIYNPVDIEKIQKLAQEKITECLWFDDNIPIIINVARLSEEKGQKYLLKAFKIVKQKVNCRLVILGEGEKEDELKQLTEKLGIQNNIAFLGFQHNPFKFMARSSVFVLSSLYEGLGNVILEAISCGVPVISTDCPGGPGEIIENGINGILVSVADEGELAKAILKILGNKNLREKLSQEAKINVNKFSIKKIIGDYHELFCANT